MRKTLRCRNNCNRINFVSAVDKYAQTEVSELLQNGKRKFNELPQHGSVKFHRQQDAVSVPAHNERFCGDVFATVLVQIDGLAEKVPIFKDTLAIEQDSIPVGRRSGIFEPGNGEV